MSPIIAAIDTATVNAIKDIASVVVAIALSYIGLSAKWSAARTKTEQDRLDSGLAWERDQRIAERKEMNDRIWKLEEKLLDCEKNRARSDALIAEWKSSQPKRGSD